MELDLTDATVAQIASFYQSPRCWLRANMVISKDGNFTDLFGSTKSLTSALDLKVLLTLRAISDAVFVGGQTVRIDNYRPPLLAGEFLELNNKSPKLIVMSRSLNFDLNTRLFSRIENSPIFITEEVHESDSNYPCWRENREKLNGLSEVIVFPAPINLIKVLEYLRKLGLNKIVCEGGPELIIQLLDLNLVDELDITQSPIDIGALVRKSTIHNAIDKWPNRVSAKLGTHQIFRIKH